jgi:hypothetical protein
MSSSRARQQGLSSAFGYDEVVSRQRLTVVTAAALLACVPAAVSCTSSCTTSDVPAFEVRVADARTRQAICDADVVVRDGAFVSVTPMIGCFRNGPGERAGHYVVHVARDGYVAQDVELTISENECHVNAQHVTVNLEPAPP